MQTTEYFNLKLADGTDIVNPLTIDRPNYETIDEVMHNNAVATVGMATELTNGTVHALTRENPETPVFRFVATADAKAGDTYTVDGVQVTALLSNGIPLSDKAYVINANVLCALTGSLLTFFVSSSISTAEDSEKLGGQAPDYYAKTADLTAVATTANNASNIALANQTALSGVKFGVDAQGNYGYFKVGADTVTPFSNMKVRYYNNATQGDIVSIPDSNKKKFMFIGKPKAMFFFLGRMANDSYQHYMYWDDSMLDVAKGFSGGNIINEMKVVEIGSNYVIFDTTNYGTNVSSDWNYFPLICTISA